MFDISSWKLIILAAIALIVVGPKDLPILLRTIGKYMGIIKRQAAEFRAQFDEAMRESELAELKKEVETLGQEAQATLREAEQSVTAEMAGIGSEIDRAVADVEQPEEKLLTTLASDTGAAEAVAPEPATVAGPSEAAVRPEPRQPEPVAVAEVLPPKPAQPVLESVGAPAPATRT